MKEWASVVRAVHAAARWHAYQKRKGLNQEPYINYLLEVANLVAEATQAKDPMVVIALLHDAIEHQEVSREMIEQQFGKAVADLVEELTDDKELPKQQRKRAQVETAHLQSNDAKLIKLTDKISKVRGLNLQPASRLVGRQRLEYVQWAREVVAGMRGASPWLEEQFARAAEEAERALQIQLRPTSSTRIG